MWLRLHKPNDDGDAVINPGYSLSLVSAPATEPVDATLIRQQCRFPANDDNSSLFATWGVAARRMIENETQLRFITQSWKLSLPMFPANGIIEIPIEPVQSITTVQYYDVSGTSQTLTATTHYLTELNRRPPVVYEAPRSRFPVTQTDRMDAVNITFVCGYGAAASVPSEAIQAILLTCSYWNYNRGDTGDDNVSVRVGLPAGALRLIRHLSVGGYR